MSWLSKLKNKATENLPNPISVISDPIGAIGGLFDSGISGIPGGTTDATTTTDTTSETDYATAFQDAITSWQETLAQQEADAAATAEANAAAAQQAYDVEQISNLATLRSQSEDLAIADAQQYMLRLEEQFRLRGVTAGFEEGFLEDTINQRFTEYWTAENENTLMGLVNQYMGQVTMPEVSSRVWSSGGTTIANPFNVDLTDQIVTALPTDNRFDLGIDTLDVIAPINMTDQSQWMTGTIKKTVT